MSFHICCQLLENVWIYNNQQTPPVCSCPTTHSNMVKSDLFKCQNFYFLAFLGSWHLFDTCAYIEKDFWTFTSTKKCIFIFDCYWLCAKCEQSDACHWPIQRIYLFHGPSDLLSSINWRADVIMMSPMWFCIFGEIFPHQMGSSYGPKEQVAWTKFQEEKSYDRV